MKNKTFLVYKTSGLFNFTPSKVNEPIHGYTSYLLQGNYA